MDNKEMHELEELKREYVRLGERIARLERQLRGKSNLPVEESSAQQYELEEIIAYHLNVLGMPQNIRGYMYTVEAVAMAVKNPNIMNNITKGLYPNVAEKFDTTGSRVERAIRHAIERCWDGEYKEIFEKYFGNSISPKKGKPTSSGFVAMLANLVRREMHTNNDALQ